MGSVIAVVATVLYVYFIVLIARLIFEWVQVFARQWHPRGAILVVAETVYTLTDPPLKLLRRIIPPLRVGQVRIDLAFLVLILSVSLLLSVLR